MRRNERVGRPEPRTASQREPTERDHRAAALKRLAVLTSETAIDYHSQEAQIHACEAILRNTIA